MVQQVLDDGVFFGAGWSERPVLELRPQIRRQKMKLSDSKRTEDKKSGLTMDLKFYFSLFLRRLPYFLILVAIGTVWV